MIVTYSALDLLSFSSKNNYCSFMLKCQWINVYASILTGLYWYLNVMVHKFKSLKNNKQKIYWMIVLSLIYFRNIVCFKKEQKNPCLLKWAQNYPINTFYNTESKWGNFSAPKITRCSQIVGPKFKKMPKIRCCCKMIKGRFAAWDSCQEPDGSLPIKAILLLLL